MCRLVQGPTLPMVKEGRGVLDLEVWVLLDHG